MLFLNGQTILRDLDLKTGSKLKIVNDTVTSIIGKRGKTRLARINSSLHHSCKFNKFNLIHANKRSAVHSHYSMSSNYYQYILVLTRDNSLCAIKKDRNALCVPGKVQRSSALRLQLFRVLHATSVSLGSNAVKRQV